MASPLAELLISAILFIALHIGVSGTAVRGRLVAAIGPGPFRGLFALLSIAFLVGMAIGYRRADGTPNLWYFGPGAQWVTIAVMLPAVLLFIGAVTGRNPTAVGGEALLKQGDAARGMLRVTRHPMLWSFALWAASHLLVRGSTAGLVFFGTFLLVSLAGMPSIDRKRETADPEGWRRFAAATSIVPFGAILAGRNRCVVAEVGWWRPALAVVVWIALMALHPLVIGVSPMPG